MEERFDKLLKGKLPEDWDFYPFRDRQCWMMENYGIFDPNAEDDPWTYAVNEMPDDVREAYEEMQKLKQDAEDGELLD